MQNKQTVILSLGGSLVVPDGIDVSFLREFVRFINRNLKKWRFIVVVGGGRTSRIYTTAASALGANNRRDLDWTGIYASRLNAQLIKTLFGRKAERKVYYNLKTTPIFRKPILIAAGYRPGWSTDFVAASMAKKLKVKKIINLTNVYYAFDKDPKKFKNASAVKECSWRRFRQIVGSKWVPGLSKPFDPIASKQAQKLGLEVIITNGADLKNLQNILNGRKFKGTVITA